MSPGRFIKSEFEEIEMQHRYEDRALITEVLVDRRPVLAIELGTAAGGFASFLARTLQAWGGSVVSVDLQRCPHQDQLLQRHSNLTLAQFDLLHPESWPGWFKALLPAEGLLVYCDNGNKPKELETIAPRLALGATLGTHDYVNEVDPAWVEPYLTALGYAPLWHERFAALADPVNYPRSLTRFWSRSEVV